MSLIFEEMPHGVMVREQGEWRDATLTDCYRLIAQLNAQLGAARVDRAAILRAIDAAAPDDAPRIRRESYIRNNPAAPIAGAGMGNN